ncbi:MAG: hypothetical protein VKK04_14240 [Synechococcales bacterium]|nr:hypothetical protein [Synechococcales bacterium]
MTEQLDLRLTLMWRFQLPDRVAQQLSQQWLTTHPNQTWNNLRALILQNQVTYEGGELVDTGSARKPLQASSTQPRYRGAVYAPGSNEPVPQPPQTKYERRYRGKAY